MLAESVATFRLGLHAFVLMDNHYHLLVETAESNLSRAMQWLNVSYSVWFNRRHGRGGHLFQGWADFRDRYGDWGRDLALYLGRKECNPPFPYWVEAGDPRLRYGQRIPNLELNGDGRRGANGGQTLAFIDLFAWAVRHEKSHHDNYHKWWTDTPRPCLCYWPEHDQDENAFPYPGDYLPDAIEPRMAWEAGGPYDPTKKKTYGDPVADDDERHTCMTAEEWVPRVTPKGDPEDWAKPGNNYKD